MLLQNLSMYDVYQLSNKAYRSQIDNKRKRMKLDVVSMKVTTKNNLSYNKETKLWENKGKNTRIVALITTKPKSYKRKDNLPKHYYPVTIIIHDVSKGIMSTFNWRTGSMKRPRFPNKAMSTKDKRKLLIQNIKNQIQMQFFFELEFILRKYNLLFGICRVTRPPRKTNPKGLIYFDKHMLFVFEKLLIPLFRSNKLQTNKSIKN